jgi:hypothetical protein
MMLIHGSIVLRETEKTLLQARYILRPFEEEKRGSFLLARRF